ncbi:MAG: FHA domain-containing protein [Gemmataceae bacterium]
MKLGLLVLTAGKQEGKVLEIKLPQFLIGRDPQCQLRPASPLISKRHCAIIQRDGKAFIRDFDSTNGTFLNDEPVKGEHELKHEDQLKIGPIQFKVTLEVSAKTPAPPTKPTSNTPVPPTKSLPAKASPSKSDTPPPATATKAKGGDDDDIAAMLLSLEEGESSLPPAEGVVPEGSTVFDMPVPPGEANGARTRKGRGQAGPVGGHPQCRRPHPGEDDPAATHLSRAGVPLLSAQPPPPEHPLPTPRGHLRAVPASVAGWRHGCSPGSATTAATCPGAATATRTASGSAKSCSSRQRSPPWCPTLNASSPGSRRSPTSRAPTSRKCCGCGRGWATSRRRHLLQAARLLNERHGGAFPSDPEALRGVPGLGEYTRNAVLSQAFDLRLPILEANSVRVLSRLFGRVEDPAGGEARRWLWRAAEAVLPPRDVGDFNQALMELGALVCTPERPSCEACPLRGRCAAFASGRPEDFPAGLRRRPRPW